MHSDRPGFSIASNLYQKKQVVNARIVNNNVENAKLNNSFNLGVGRASKKKIIEIGAHRDAK
jgi:hypothetical protein